jgi:ABC-2 type transport system ATP-binding protein
MKATSLGAAGATVPHSLAGSAAALQFRGLGKDYRQSAPGGGIRAAVASLDLDIARGEVFGLLGPNGAGKTTSILMACGVITSTRGKVSVCGFDMHQQPKAAKRHLGLVPQELAIYEALSARQNLTYFAEIAGLRGESLEAAVKVALDIAELADRADEPCKQFSGGMKRRLNLACGVVHKPDVLVLDEPTVGVDPQSRNHIFAAIKMLAAQGMTILYTSHYMEEVEALCDRIAIMDGGKIVAAGRIADLIATHAGAGVDIVVDGQAAVAALLAAQLGGTWDGQRQCIRIADIASIGMAVAAIDMAALRIAQIASRQANLETVFLALTGKALRDE